MANKPLKSIKFPGLPDTYTIDSGLTDAAKSALLTCFQHVAWADEHGQNYYDALETALRAGQYPKIQAEYTSSTHTVYSDDYVDSLKPYLTVTYFENKASSGIILRNSDYTLSGSLTSGYSTVTIAYNLLTTDVVIPVIQSPIVGLNKCGGGVYSASGVDTWYCLVTPRDARGVIVTQSNFAKLKTKTTSESTPSGVSAYCPIRIPEGADSIVYQFGSSGWSAVTILTLDDNTGLYTRIGEITAGNFTGETDITVSVASYNDGHYFIVPFANNSEQDPSKVSCHFTFT